MAVAQAGRAALFVGHSGAGKSTLGGLWAEAGGVVLADELVAVWPVGGESPSASATGGAETGGGVGAAPVENPGRGGGASTLSAAPDVRSGAGGARTWFVAGTPWNVGVSETAVLNAVGTLAWDMDSRMETQAAGEVGRMLLVNALLPEATASGRGGLLAASGRLLSDVAPVRLVFARNASASAVVRGALEAMGRG